MGVKKIAIRTVRWTASAAMLPMAYIWLPFSCCFVSPVTKIASPQFTKEIKDLPGDQKCFANVLLGGFMGAVTIVSCCCCCGKCCTADPDDVFYHNNKDD
jgi:hypothetical protein